MPHTARWATALAVAASPLTLAGHVAHSRKPVTHAIDPAGLTVADGRPGSAIITSLRSNGPAERGGIAVGDEVRAVDGHHTRGAAAVRHDLRHARHCRVALDLRRAGRPLMATVGRCGRGGS
ncbi:MAG: PDZ domain-containing protein [Sphingobium sp.]